MNAARAMGEAVKRNRARRRRAVLVKDSLFSAALFGLVAYTVYMFYATDAGLLFALGPSGIIGLIVLFLAFHEKRQAFTGAR